MAKKSNTTNTAAQIDADGDADKTDKANKAGVNNAPASGEQQATSDMPYRLHAQYLNDLSFENPGALKKQSGGAPSALQYNVHWHIGNNPLPVPGGSEAPGGAAAIYQAEVRVTLSAHYGGEAHDKNEEKNKCFVLEVSMMAVVEIAANISDKRIHQQILRIEIPHLLYPYLRHQADRVLSDGGYPPINLPPLNFAEAYRQYMRQPDAVKS